MDYKQQISELKTENQLLKVEIERLKLELNILRNDEWAHPNSCVYNKDPWESWKDEVVR